MIVNQNYAIYRIRIGLESSKRNLNQHKNRVCDIKDSTLLFPTSIADMGKNLNKTYNTDIYTKGENDYNRKDKYNNFEELENDTDEYEYLIKDVWILYHFHTHIEGILPRKK
jgi:hypothetical protein